MVIDVIQAFDNPNAEGKLLSKHINFLRGSQ